MSSSACFAPMPLQDVAIIGTGPAGSTVAIALKQSVPGLRVCLVDAQQFPRDKACGDGLGPGVHGILSDLGLPRLVEDHPLVNDLIISGLKRDRITGTLPALHSGVPRGRVVPRKIFDHRLRLAAIDRGAASIENARLTGAAFDIASHCWNLTFNSDATLTLRSRVLIGADGARSAVRRLLGIPFNSPDHTDIAIRSYVDYRLQDSQRRALEFHYTRALLPGYAWVFPAQGDRANVGVGLTALDYQARPRHLKRLLQDFFQEWSSEVGHDPAQGPTEIKAFILPHGSQLPPLAIGTAALVGDAASMINPLTGEGIHYAMSGAQILAHHIAEGIREDLPFEVSLRRYEQAFRAQFQRHYATAFRLKRVIAVPALSNMLVRACFREPRILVDIIEMIMAEGRRFSPVDAARILATGLWP